MNRPAEIPADLQRLIDSERNRDERITWSAQPLAGRSQTDRRPVSGELGDAALLALFDAESGGGGHYR